MIIIHITLITLHNNSKNCENFGCVSKIRATFCFLYYFTHFNGLLTLTSRLLTSQSSKNYFNFKKINKILNSITSKLPLSSQTNFPKFKHSHLNKGLFPTPSPQSKNRVKSSPNFYDTVPSRGRPTCLPQGSPATL